MLDAGYFDHRRRKSWAEPKDGQLVTSRSVRQVLGVAEGRLAISLKKTKDERRMNVR